MTWMDDSRKFSRQGSGPEDIWTTEMHAYIYQFCEVCKTCAIPKMSVKNLGAQIILVGYLQKTAQKDGYQTKFLATFNIESQHDSNRESEDIDVGDHIDGGYHKSSNAAFGTKSDVQTL